MPFATKPLKQKQIKASVTFRLIVLSDSVTDPHPKHMVLLFALSHLCPACALLSGGLFCSKNATRAWRQTSDTLAEPWDPWHPWHPCMTPMACKARFCSTRSAWPNPTTIQASLVMVEVFHEWQTCCWRICSCTCCARREGRRMFQGLNLEGIETVHSFLVTPKR